MRERIVDQCVTALDRAHVDDRAENHRAVSRIAERQRTRAHGEPLDEFIGDLFVDDNALGRHADLPRIGECTEDCRIDRSVNVRIVKHDERRLAAEFEHCRFQMTGALFRDQAPHACRTREVDPSDLGMGDQRVDDTGCV
ncbi:hypothetical protein WS66_00855 [Burkholderia sp. LA-2-3-30-S1-D2]|nr:hypothetical protein WS66_00855 [Burkholderia sp. LA-2-3-30-S1-D2]KVE10691.1 hypothetical protein WS66_21760 [Burkholderia sp. LA-2-3-30-S1-D2]